MTPPAAAADRPATLALWPLPLLAGLLPALAVLVALWLSSRLGLIPLCNPFVEGCVSISRAARYELPNHLFRALVLPAAALQAITWLLAARWLAGLGQPSRWLAPLGLTAGAALVLYGTFLGTEGPAYRWMRQYGIVISFGFTCLCMLLAGGAIQRLVAQRRLQVPGLLARALVGLGAVLVTLGVVNAMVSPLLAEPAKDRLQNITEWWGALAFVAAFVVLAAIWYRCRLRVRLETRLPA